MSRAGPSPELLADFRAETTEHLGAVEAAILQGGDERDRVNTLFRAFHSIKGLARVVGQGALEELAHAAETMLGTVRSGVAPLDGSREDALIAALDEARRLASRGGTPAENEPSFRSTIATLEALAAGATTASRDDRSSPGPDQPWRLLTADEDLLAALLELAEELLPSLHAAADAGKPDAATEAAFRDDAETLAYAVEQLGLHGATETMRRLLDAGPGQRPAALAALAKHIRNLARLIGRVATLPPEVATAPPSAETVDVSPDAKADPPPGLAGATIDVRCALADRPAPGGLVEFLMAPLEAMDLGDALVALAREPAVIAVQHRPAEGRHGLAVLAASDGRDPTARVAELGLTHRVDAVASVNAGMPSRLFGAAPTKPAHPDEAQVRVPIDVLDRLFGRVGEFFSVGSWLNVLVFDSGIPDVIARLSEHAVMRAPELTPDIEKLQRFQRDISGVESEVGRLVSLIHESTLGLRVIPLESLVNRFPRMIRETARETGKSVRLDARTGGIKIDKGMSEMLADPLMHLLRNAIDHGIEPPEERRRLGKPVPAVLTLEAVQNGNRIEVALSDDGRGIDVEAVRRKAVAQHFVSEEESLRLAPAQIARFIFAAGFSTAGVVSSVSGRGVGMDVALVNVTKLGGTIEIETEAGAGTTFRLDMPLSAAIQPMLLVETAVQTIGLPEPMVAEATMVSRASLQQVNGQAAVLFHGRFLPVFDLASLLRLPHGEGNDTLLPLVVCEWRGQRIGLAVRRILRRNEMLIRETHPRVARLPGIGGVTTLGFDRIVLVADPDGVFDLARRSATRGLETDPSRLSGWVTSA